MQYWYVISQSGGVTLVDLGTGTSFDVKALAPNVDYTTLTNDNFFVSDISDTSIPANTSTYPFSSAGWAKVRHPVGFYGGSVSETKSYDNSTGILSFYITGSGSGGATETSCSNCQRLIYSNSVNVPVHAYLIY